MGALFMIFLTALFAVVSAMITLIHVGGWLNILVAILLVLFWLFSACVTVIVSVADLFNKSKKKENKNA